MRLVCRLLPGMMFAAAGLWAGDTLSDTFNSTIGCWYSFSAPYSNCDVIGDLDKYDIKSVTAHVGPWGGTVDIDFNYGRLDSLADFDDGIVLGIGDLLFFNPAQWAAQNLDPQTFNPALAHPLLYGIPLFVHDGLTEGELYKVGGGITLKTADDLIHNRGYYYRRGEIVRLSGTDAAIGLGSVTTVPNGDGVSAGLLKTTVTFSASDAFLAEIVDPTTGNFGLSFAAAWCGNDVIRGVLTPERRVAATAETPEPGSLVLLGSGVVLAIVARHRFRKHA